MGTGSRILLEHTLECCVYTARYYSTSPLPLCFGSTSIQNQMVCSYQFGDDRERIFRIFRQAIYAISLQDLKEIQLSGEIEIDEALFGGHRKESKRGWGAEGKSLVFGIYQRNGKVITFPVSDRKHDTLVPLISQHTKKGSLYYSDDHPAYITLNLIGKHKIIDHGTKEYVRENTIHINGIEDFWSHAKTWLYHYRGVPKQYFHLYMKEVEFRFNNREKEDLFTNIALLLVKLVEDP